MFKFTVYNFPDGTMITYNPSLKDIMITEEATQLDSNIVNSLIDNTDDIDGLDGIEDLDEILNTNINDTFNKQFLSMHSTRTVIGTGKFGSNKTFLEMFNENNTIANTNLDNIPESLIKDRVLVFNIEHPDNQIISKCARNYNTLCAVYQFKSENDTKTQYEDIMKLTTETIDNEVLTAFRLHGMNMINQINIEEFVSQVREFNTNINIPQQCHTIKQLDNINISINELSIQQLENITQNTIDIFQGYIIYGLYGERTKISNQKYKELKILKGNKPITVEPSNIKNLFILYWRLLQTNAIYNFLTEFDTNNKPGYEFIYTRIFNWFLGMVSNYSAHLFQVYHFAFVKRIKQKSDIPFSMKPLCGELHKLYLANRVPITKIMVDKFIYEQPNSKLYWRLFTVKDMSF